MNILFRLTTLLICLTQHTSEAKLGVSLPPFGGYTMISTCNVRPNDTNAQRSYRSCALQEANDILRDFTTSSFRFRGVSSLQVDGLSTTTTMYGSTSSAFGFEQGQGGNNNNADDIPIPDWWRRRTLEEGDETDDEIEEDEEVRELLSGSEFRDYFVVGMRACLIRSGQSYTFPRTLVCTGYAGGSS
mmetsp:Transcript_36303/g.55774  ORF Transcript_36303/g.55774 Transcript_36303/m.55774 type:complete len:187 (+) Transcript_36303:109-669(+)